MQTGITLIIVGWAIVLTTIVVAALAHVWARRKRPLTEDFPELSEGK